MKIKVNCLFCPLSPYFELWNNSIFCYSFWFSPRLHKNLTFCPLQSNF